MRDPRACELAFAVDNQEAVDGGVGLCFQKCGLGMKFCLCLFTAGDVAKKAIGVQQPIFFVSAHGAVLHPDPGAIFSADAVFLVKSTLVIK